MPTTVDGAGFHKNDLKVSANVNVGIDFVIHIKGGIKWHYQVLITLMLMHTGVYS